MKLSIGMRVRPAHGEDRDFYVYTVAAFDDQRVTLSPHSTLARARIAQSSVEIDRCHLRELYEVVT